MKGGDCNLDIMPPRTKKNNNKQMSDKLNLKKTALSKSQKRKLKKLEEEKERELLSAKTSHLLDKYKISEDVSLLLQSSKAIRRVKLKFLIFLFNYFSYIVFLFLILLLCVCVVSV